MTPGEPKFKKSNDWWIWAILVATVIVLAGSAVGSALSGVYH